MLEALLGGAEVHREIVFDQWEIGHRHVRHARVLEIPVFRHHYIPAPGFGFLVVAPLCLAQKFVDWKRHPVTRQHRVENNVRRAELFSHPIETLDDLNNNRAIVVSFEQKGKTIKELTWHPQAWGPRFSAM